jgi:3-oxoacyl-[acyl-carrier-protein] synthase III
VFDFKQRVNTKEYDQNYTRIFGDKQKKDIKIEYQRNPSEQQEESGTTITVLDDNGKKIDKITVYHKNKMYKQAKELRGRLEEDICTRSECWNPNRRNVNKMIRELHNPKVRAYKMAMQAIGAEPKDCDTERLRRR